MMLKCDFRSILYLVDAHFKNLTERCRCHRAGSSNLSLTAAFRTAYRGVCFNESSYKARNHKRLVNLLIRERVLFLHIFEYRGKNCTGSAGGGCNYNSVISILLAHRVCVRANETVFASYGAFIKTRSAPAAAERTLLTCWLIMPMGWLT